MAVLRRAWIDEHTKQLRLDFDNDHQFALDVPVGGDFLEVAFTLKAGANLVHMVHERYQAAKEMHLSEGG